VLGAGHPLAYWSRAPAAFPHRPGWLGSYVALRNLADLDQEFSSAYGSDRGRAIWVLGHLTVIAELGLGTLTGRAIRDPRTFEGGWARDRRVEHILARAGFVHALWARSDRDVTMYRGVGLRDTAAHPDGGGGRKMPWSRRRYPAASPRAIFGSADAAAGALCQQRLQSGRLFKTSLETGAITRQYREAEAVLLPGSGPFF
jgi:hypothetical protein